MDSAVLVLSYSVIAFVVSDLALARIGLRDPATNERPGARLPRLVAHAGVVGLLLLPVALIFGLRGLAFALTPTAVPTPSPTPVPPTVEPTATPAPTSEPTPSAVALPSERPGVAPSAGVGLLAHVPESFGPTCEMQPTPVYPGAMEAIMCSPEVGLRVLYIQFADVASMDAVYDVELATNGAASTASDCTAGPGQNTYTVAGVESGRFFCYETEFTGAAAMVWTNEPLAIYADALRDDGNFTALEETWQGAGPFP